MVNTTSYSRSLEAYISDNTFWQKFLDIYNNQNPMPKMFLKKIYHLPSGDRTYTKEVVDISINENIQLGQPLSITLTLADSE